MREDELDRLLSQARSEPMAPSEALMSRVMADALAAMPKAAAPATAMPPPPAPRRGIWASLVAGFGGSGVLAGLGAAAALGLMVGYVDPAGLGGLADGFLATSGSSLELAPAADIFLTEG